MNTHYSVLSSKLHSETRVKIQRLMTYADKTEPKPSHTESIEPPSSSLPTPSLDYDLLSDSYSLEKLSSLNPIVQNLVHAVVDIYAHRRDGFITFFLEENSIRLNFTAALSKIAICLFDAYIKSCNDLRAVNIRKFEDEFCKKYGIVYIKTPKSRSLEDSILDMFEGSISADFSAYLPKHHQIRIPDSLPWKQLHSRLLSWEHEMKKYKEILNMDKHNGGLKLSKTLVAAQQPQHIVDSDSDGAERGGGGDLNDLNFLNLNLDWSSIFRQARQESQALATTSTSMQSSWLLCQYRNERASIEKALTDLEAITLRRLLEEFMNKYKKIELNEYDVLKELEAKRVLFLKGSILGENAIERELRQATAGNEYAWRAVQRTIQTLYSKYESGLQKAYMRTYENHLHKVDVLWMSTREHMNAL